MYGFVSDRLDGNSKGGGGILSYEKDKIIVLPLNRHSPAAYWDFIFWFKSTEPKMACMLFLKYPQKLNQKTFTSN